MAGSCDARTSFLMHQDQEQQKMAGHDDSEAAYFTESSEVSHPGAYHVDGIDNLEPPPLMVSSSLFERCHCKREKMGHGSGDDIKY